MAKSKNNNGKPEEVTKDNTEIDVSAVTDSTNPVDDKPSNDTGADADANANAIAANTAVETKEPTKEDTVGTVIDETPAVVEISLDDEPKVKGATHPVSLTEVTDKSRIDDELVDEPINYSTEESGSNFDPNFQPENAYPLGRNASPHVSNSQLPPPKPRRPTSAPSAEETLKEAFPGISPSIITAVLIASNGELGPAFNALLSMSDPSFKPELPTRKPQQQPIGSPQSQIEEDERLARRLAQDYERRTQQRSNLRASGDSKRVPQGVESNYHSSQQQQQQQQQQRRQSQRNESDDDGPFNFLEEEFPQFKATIEKSLNETKTTINSWMKNFQKKFEESIEPNLAPRYEDEPLSSSTTSSTTKRGLFGALGGSPILPSKDDNRYGYSNSRIIDRNDGRRNTRQSYDNKVEHGLGEINLEDEDLVETPDHHHEPKPPKPTRPTKSSHTQPLPSLPKPVSEDTIPKAESELSNTWESLNTVDAMPEKDQEAFFIGDSEDEEDDENENDVPVKGEDKGSSDTTKTVNVESEKIV